MSSPHQETVEALKTPERIFAEELREMFTQATTPASVGIPWVDVIRRIVEAAERMADARDRERP